MIIKRINNLRSIYSQIIKLQKEKISKINPEGDIIEKYRKIKEKLTSLDAFLGFSLPK